MKRISLLLCIMFGAIASYGQFSCPNLNFPTGPFPKVVGDAQEHATGAHGLSSIAGGYCHYSQPAQGSICRTQGESYAFPVSIETGKLNCTACTHHTSVTAAGGIGTAYGTVTTDAEGIVGVADCGLFGCVFGVTLSGSGNGAGFSANFTGTAPLWSDKQYYENTCPAFNVPDPPTCDSGNISPSSGVDVTALPKCSRSPILIDTTGKGFKLSDPNIQYISFDMGDGKLHKVSWPIPGNGNAWLVYDSGNGVITNLTQLFGNNSQFTNGFLKLAVWDQTDHGGNYDLVIDNKDKVWPKMINGRLGPGIKLWYDSHCQINRNAPCRSLPQELYAPDSTNLPFGAKPIHSISIVYQGFMKKDQHGNLGKFASMINTLPDQPQVSNDKRQIVDFWLVEKK